MTSVVARGGNPSTGGWCRSRVERTASSLRSLSLSRVRGLCRFHPADSSHKYAAFFIHDAPVYAKSFNAEVSKNNGGHAVLGALFIETEKKGLVLLRSYMVGIIRELTNFIFLLFFFCTLL